MCTRIFKNNRTHFVLFLSYISIKQNLCTMYVSLLAVLIGMHSSAPIILLAYAIAITFQLVCSDLQYRFFMLGCIQIQPWHAFTSLVNFSVNTTIHLTKNELIHIYGQLLLRFLCVSFSEHHSMHLLVWCLSTSFNLCLYIDSSSRMGLNVCQYILY